MNSNQTVQAGSKVYRCSSMQGLTVFLGAELLGFRAVGCCMSQAVLAAMPSGPPELIGGKTCRGKQG